MVENLEATEERDNILVIEYLEEQLGKYKEEFREYFKKEYKEIIEYFNYAPIGQSIYGWLFEEANISRLPVSAKRMISNVKGLSKINGLSFIRQFKLADKLECSDRWVRNIASRLKQIGLFFAVKTNKIQYSITFALHKSVGNYFDTIVAIVFEHYQIVVEAAALKTNIATKINNTGNTTNTSGSSSGSSSGSKRGFSLAKCLYEKSCGKSSGSEYKRKKENSKNEEGMHAIGGEPAKPSINTISNFFNEEKRTVTINTAINNTTNDAIEDKVKVIKSIYDYELCEKYTIEYARIKLGTNDEINDIGAFARYCHRSGEKDNWIKAFVDSNYSIEPYNPLKNNSIEEISRVNISANANANAKQKEEINETTEAKKVNEKEEKPQEIKGKYSINIYLDFINKVEEPRLKALGRKVYKKEALARSMRVTGNDDVKVGQFVEQMKAASIGARPSDFVGYHFIGSNLGVEQAEIKQMRELKESEQALKRKQEYENLLKQEELKDKIWINLAQSEQSSLLKGQMEGFRRSKYFNSHYRFWSEKDLKEHAIYVIKGALLEKGIREQEIIS